MGCINNREEQNDDGIDNQDIKEQKEYGVKEELSIDINIIEFGAVHKDIRLEYINVKVEEIIEDPYAIKLKAFNGYYQLERGGFLTIDTNIIVIQGRPILMVFIIVSLEGEKSSSKLFNGTFDDNKLIMMNWMEYGLNLDFTRVDNNEGIIASFAGIIKTNTELIIEVSGSTRNNAIPYSVYFGEYYEIIPFWLKMNAKYVQEEIAVPVMKINNNYELEYNNGNAILKPVTDFIYNLNMYYFTFVDNKDIVFLIMGTSAAGGFMCNNMTIGSSASARSLQTIPFPNKVNPNATPNGNSHLLAPFSGYYKIEGNGGEFISIEAEYTIIPGESPINKVKIGVYNGTISKCYVFDDSMSFENNKLKIPGVISIDLVREYKPENGSLVQLSGTIDGKMKTGCTHFNPVILSAFGGKYYAAKDGSVVINVKSDLEVEYKGNNVGKFLYIPIMYILGCNYNANKPTMVMSFGTNGVHGNACIITQYYDNKPPDISYVSAIP